jgi:hypothetical protein
MKDRTDMEEAIRELKGATETLNLAAFGVIELGGESQEARTMIYISERLRDLWKRMDANFYAEKSGPRMVPRCDGGGQ